MADKKYAKGISIKEFGNYGDLNVSIKIDKLIESAPPNEKGYINLVIKKRRETSEYGETHYAEINEWKPRTGTNNGEYLSAKETEELDAKESDGLPF